MDGGGLIRTWLVDGMALPAALLAWGFALFVFRVAPRNLVTGQLVALLVLDGINVFTSGLLPPPVLDWYLSTGLSSSHLHYVTDFGVAAVYLPFLGSTLDSKLVRPFRNPLVRWACWILGAVLAVIALVRIDWLLPYQSGVRWAISVIFLWGFIAATDSWRCAKTEIARVRARSFTIAFGVRDVLWSWAFGTYAAYSYGWLAADNPWLGISIRGYALAVIIYVPLVAYGILRAHLFDIDLRLKLTIKRSTIAAAFVAIFFLTSELAATFLSERLGTVLGLVIAAGVVFLLDPLHRFANQLADVALPQTQSTPEYEAFRKLQVYESALLAAYEDGSVSDRQRRVLEALKSSLGLSPGDAERLEADVQAGQVAT